MDNEIVLSIVTNEIERAQAVAYIEESLRAVFKCEPPATKGIICIARLNGEIAASLVVQGTRLNQPFSLEEHYDFDNNLTPFPFYRPHLMQATRWNSTNQLASLMVIHACAVLARDAGKDYMLMEAKQRAVDRIREIGMICEPIPGAILNIDRARAQVGDAGMRYYLDDPVPTIYMLPIENMVTACASQIRTTS